MRNTRYPKTLGEPPPSYFVGPDGMLTIVPSIEGLSPEQQARQGFISSCRRSSDGALRLIASVLMAKDRGEQAALENCRALPGCSLPRKVRGRKSSANRQVEQEWLEAIRRIFFVKDYTQEAMLAALGEKLVAALRQYNLDSDEWLEQKLSNGPDDTFPVPMAEMDRNR